MTAPSVWAVVPVKPFSMAKLRLATVLTDAERARLARVMFEDVLDALVASRHLLAGLIVLTSDCDAAAIAHTRGAFVVAEREPAGINEALARAVDHLAGEPDAGLLVVPADLPHVSAAAVEEVLGCLGPSHAVALVPAIADGGTNMLACRPPGVIPTCFGPRSFEAHRRAAQRAGAALSVLAWPDLGRDIDRPQDLEAFLRLGTATRTHAFLASLRHADDRETASGIHA
jgi:2-phospho-L-lactate guanylyltransferase